MMSLNWCQLNRFVPNTASGRELFSGQVSAGHSKLVRRVPNATTLSITPLPLGRVLSSSLAVREGCARLAAIVSTRGLRHWRRASELSPNVLSPDQVPMLPVTGAGTGTVEVACIQMVFLQVRPPHRHSYRRHKLARQSNLSAQTRSDSLANCASRRSRQLARPVTSRSARPARSSSCYTATTISAIRGHPRHGSCQASYGDRSRSSWHGTFSDY